MFDKNCKTNTGYINPNTEGTNTLRALVGAKIYAGDPMMEEKLTKYQLYWKFYNNQHWNKNNDKLLSFNYVRALIDKVNSFMIGAEGFELNIKDFFGDSIAPDLETSYEALLNYNWRSNHKKVFLQRLTQMGSICGNAYVFLVPNIQDGYIEYRLLDSRVTIPMFDNGDYSRIKGYKSVKQLGYNDKEYILHITEYTVGNVKTYYTKETGEKAEQFEVENVTNSYPFLPIVHIENLPMSDSYGGRSDVEDIVKINKIYNEMAEDIKMTVDYYAQPTTVITGGTVGQLKRGINQIWSGLPPDANVFNLSLGEDLSASMNFLKLLKDSMHDLSGVPEEVLSKVQHISNTSAAALQMLYQSIIQIADKKSVTYSEGIETINMLTGIMFALSINDHPLLKKLPKDARSTDVTTLRQFYFRYRTETIWKYSLPNDRRAQLDEADIELRNKLASRREIMERLGKLNIPKIQAEIREDIEQDIKDQKELKQAEKQAEGEPTDPEEGNEQKPPKNA